MSLEERAREFVDREVFTDGLGRNAGRLVMEFDAKIPGTGWGKGPIVNKFVAFAASEVRAERARIAARLMDLVLQTREQYWGQQIADALNDSAKLASAIEVLRLLATPEFWDCLEPECGGVGSCQNDSHSKVVWITHAEGNGYDDARKWLEENVEATQDDSNGR